MIQKQRNRETKLKMKIFQILFLLFTVFAMAFGEMHRFCGDHGDCKHVDKNNPEECCISGPLNGYHECLANPNPNHKCPPLPEF